MDAHISGTFHLPLWRQETLVKWASLSRAIDAKRRNTISHRKPCKCFYLTPLHHHPHILYTSLLWPTFTPPLLMPLACGVQYCSNLAIFQWCLSASVCSSKTVSTNSNTCRTVKREKDFQSVWSDCEWWRIFFFFFFSAYVMLFCYWPKYLKWCSNGGQCVSPIRIFNSLPFLFLSMH